MAVRTAGPGPRGFSLEASFTIRSGARPNSRASSSRGLRGMERAMLRTYPGPSRDGSDDSAMRASALIPFLINRCRIRSQHLEKWGFLAKLGEGCGNIRL